MRVHSPTRYAALAALVGALACASNKARTDETAAAAKDTTTTGRDTVNQAPPGYRGMERDTSQVRNGQTPSDTFLQNQGVGQPQDTSGYSGIERVDTSGARADTSGVRTDTTGMQRDTTGMQRDTTGAGGVTDTSRTGADTSGYNRSNPSSANPSGLDTTGQSKTGDTTGYGQSQQQRDSTSR